MPRPVRDLMRAINRAKILETIRTVGMISRIDIARTTGLSQASITGLSADLIKEGLIIEKQSGKYKGGRRPMLLALNPEGAFVVGANLSISELSVVIANFEGTVVASYAHPLAPIHHSVSEIADRVAGAVQACIWEANFAKEQISGVGIGIPGLVDPDAGTIRFLPNYGWENANFKERVQNKLNHPCYIDNSSNTLALAEQWFGEGKGIDNFLVVTIENGIGLGAVINGRIYRGQDGIAGEFGHMTIDPEGPECRCGKKGCVEAYAGNLAIMRDARLAAIDGRWDCDDPDQFTYEEMLGTAKDGVAVLRQLFSHAGHILGIGISHLITLFNPSKIIITGQGVQAGELIFDAMASTLEQSYSAKFGRRTTRIIIQQWTEQDWARGAGALVLQELYKSPVGQVATHQ
ncbi:MAG: ROK family transcriptional regulator [Desulfosarcinaceae bacterium]